MDDSTDGGGEGRELLLLIVALVASAGLATADLAGDLAEGAATWHLMTEAAVTLAVVAGLAVLVRRFVRLRRQQRALHEEASELFARLRESRAEAVRWRREAGDILAGLGVAIDQQFVRWELTGAEKEVALLMLKGLSHKEIAGVRQVSEGTVRQQARTVYKKGGVNGRNELSAFFLEDLLLPPTPSAMQHRHRPPQASTLR